MMNRLLVMAFCWTLPVWALAQDGTTALILEMEGTVEVSRAGTEVWTPARTNQVVLANDRVRTGSRARAVVRLSDMTMVRVGAQTTIRVPSRPKESGFDLLKGIIYFFHRDKPRQVPVRTPSAYAVVLGTEFQLAVGADGSSVLHLVDGRVTLTNEFGELEVRNGESAEAVVNGPPRRTAAIEAVNRVQWWLYYPAVLDVDELGLKAEEVAELSSSISAYRQGDLLAALALHPDNRQPASDQERVYLAALLLSVGQVTEAERLLRDLTGENVLLLSEALMTLIAAVNLQPVETQPSARASSLLAWSYYHQSRFDLKAALRAARGAVDRSPEFAFAWARVAELEFGFGRLDRAQRALDESLRLAPRNAAAVTLGGFILAGRNRLADAIEAFNRAIELDGAIGDAWLGRGLCRIRRGALEAGRQDLQVAATLEPQRAVLRSYLGKAFQAVNDPERAGSELRLARELDPNDPTPWLYSALRLQQQNRNNAAIVELERSRTLNDNRGLYRSSLLLDQDLAVKGANLAVLYEDVGMLEVSHREASRAVDLDYANYSAHLFLANSYQAMREPQGFNERFESAAVGEYLLTSLLAPPGAGILAQSVSSTEYSSLFEQDGLRFSGQADYFSYGHFIVSGAQYGNFGNLSYAVSAYHRSDNGQHLNSDLEQTELSVQVKQQATRKDGFYLRAVYGRSLGGDLAGYYDPALPVEMGGPSAGLRFKEEQEPLMLLGYHREWRPGVHTLALGAWLNDDFQSVNPAQSTLVLERGASGEVLSADPILFEQDYRNTLEIFSGELQQIWQTENRSLTVGGRFQTGGLDTGNVQASADSPFAFLFPAEPQLYETDFQRISFYGYERWRPIDSVQLSAGAGYDRMTFPDNFRYAPVSAGEGTKQQVSPKAGLIWTPAARTTVRAGYARSMGGISFERSFSLEPTEIAGFNQAFRSVMPESVVGASAGARIEGGGLSIEHRTPSRTCLGLTGEWLESEVDREIGVFDQEAFAIQTGQTREMLSFRERTLRFTVNQLADEEWSFGARYRLSLAELNSDFREISRTAVESLLHQVRLWAIYNHGSGMHGRVESIWTSQSNHGYQGSRPGDDFWQFNAWVGYRFAQRRVELRLGLLNIGDQDYRLNPLNLTPELPRGRTLVAGTRFNF